MGFAQNAGLLQETLGPPNLSHPTKLYALWKGQWVVHSLGPPFLQKALEEDQVTSEDGRVAYSWKWISGYLGPFIDLSLAQSWKKPTLVHSLAPPTNTQAQQRQPQTVNSKKAPER